MRVVPMSPRLRRRFIRLVVALAVAGIAGAALLIPNPKQPNPAPPKTAPPAGPADYASPPVSSDPPPRAASETLGKQWLLVAGGLLGLALVSP